MLQSIQSNSTHGQRNAGDGAESEATVFSNAYHTSCSSPIPPESLVDLIFENHFSLFLIRSLSPVGQAWLNEHVGDEETQHFGNAIVCEPRYIEPIMLGAIEAGLEVAQ